MWQEMLYTHTSNATAASTYFHGAADASCAATGDASEEETTACGAVTALDDDTACAAATNCVYAAAEVTFADARRWQPAERLTCHFTTPVIFLVLLLVLLLLLLLLLLLFLVT